MKPYQFPWDHHSDQPHVIRDRQFKRQMYKAGALGSLKTLLAALIVLPRAWLLKLRGSTVSLPAPASNIGLCINLESPLPEKRTVSISEQIRLAEGAGIQHILVRVPIDQAPNLQAFLEIAEQPREKSLLVDILQDRKHIDNLYLAEEDLRKIFTAFSGRTNLFKIGNAINRRKWAFVSLEEYFRFFKTAQQLRDREFPNIKLLGGSIIDFELPNFARSLLHFAPINYDGVAALLYVDRRGAPENTQLGANLLGKIDWFKTIMRLSNKTADKLYITETNWPLVDTEPFAPAVGDCMVSEDQQAAYLARYYLLAFASGKVEAVYWHQLVAPGYGLIDNRGQTIRKRKAYYALKALTNLFNQATITHFENKKGIYLLTADSGEQRITAVWTNDEVKSLEISALQILNASSSSEKIQILDLTGAPLEHRATLSISGDVTYFIQHCMREL